MQSSRTLGNPLQLNMETQMSQLGNRASNRHVNTIQARATARVAPLDLSQSQHGHHHQLHVFDNPNMQSQRAVLGPPLLGSQESLSGGHFSKAQSYSTLPNNVFQGNPPAQSLRRLPTIDELTSDPTKMFENYQRLEADIERKRHRIAELRQQNSSARVSNDDAQVQNLQKSILRAREDLNKVRLEIKQLDVIKSQRMADIRKMDNELAGLQALQKREDYLARTVSSLQGELNMLRSDLALLNTEYTTTEENAIRRLETEFRDKTSRKMFEICMEAAQKSDDPRVKKLYEKLLPKLPLSPVGEL